MDVHKAVELSVLADKQIQLANNYCEARQKAGSAKSDLDILLAAELCNIRGRKSNVGYEMAVLMLMETNQAAQDLHKEIETQTAKYKSLEKMIEAVKTKILLEQSIMKYVGEGERYG